MSTHCASSWLCVGAMIAGCARGHHERSVAAGPLAVGEETTPRAETPLPPVLFADVRAFAADARARAAVIEDAVEREVRRRQIDPRAVAEMHTRRAYLEQVLDRYVRDGRIDAAERQHVELLLARMREAPRAYAHVPNGW